MSDCDHLWRHHKSWEQYVYPPDLDPGTMIVGDPGAIRWPVEKWDQWYCQKCRVFENLPHRLPEPPEAA